MSGLPAPEGPFMVDFTVWFPSGETVTLAPVRVFRAEGAIVVQTVDMSMEATFYTANIGGYITTRWQEEG